jgi:amidase
VSPAEARSPLVDADGPHRHTVAVLADTASIGSAHMGDLCDLPATELRAAMAARDVSAREVLDAHIRRIDAWNPVVNAIVTRTTEAAQAQAAALDDTLARGGALGPLHGLPIAHKDLVDTAGVRTTYGSPIYAEHVPDADEPFVARVRQAGAVMVGKTNTPEFGAGSHTFNPVFGPTRNPYDPSRSAGGSSGGAAAGLATGMVPIADGSDLGGSLRNPASFCNVVGFRPTLGDVDPLELSTDGPMARTVADASLLWAVMTGDPARAAVETRPTHGVRIAWAPSFADTLPVEPAVADVVAATGAVFEALGCVLLERYPDLGGAREVFFTLRARSFAVDYGDLLADHRERIKATVVWNIEQGLELPATAVDDALATMQRVRARAAGFFADVDYLVQPVAQVAPFDIDLEFPRDVAGVEMFTYLDWMASCWQITVLGGPAISVPCGFTSDGLPVGLQIVGRRGDDAGVLALARSFEGATRMGERRPALP